jgi:hypothetical protein
MMFEIEITAFQPEPGVSRSTARTAGEAEARCARARASRAW